MRTGVITSINPRSEEIIGETSETDLGELPEFVQRARKAQDRWGSWVVEKRVEAMRRLLSILRRSEQRITKLIHAEMGKPLHEALSEVRSVPVELAYYLSEGPKFLREEEDATVPAGPKTDRSIVRFEPLGVVAIITPWNSPFATIFRSAIPALLAGNAILIKPSEYTTLVGLEAGNILSSLDRESQTKGIAQVIIGGKDAGKALVAEDVDIICFTGSLRTGQNIAAASAFPLHRLVLELGGKDPAIVLADADLSIAVPGIVEGALRNAGQVCCAIERVYVAAKLYKKFVQKIVEEVRKRNVGRRERMGPLIRPFQRSIVEEHVADALERGAKLHCGGVRPKGKGYFFPPTVLSAVTHEMKIMREETFGPVIPIMAFRTIADAIALANDTPYGLTASIWTKKVRKAREIATELRTGTVAINRYGSLRIGCPWGGTKQSGIGRLCEASCVREFCTSKHIWIS